MADTIDTHAFDPEQPATYERYSEETSSGGRIVLVRYPEGYRLRFNGEVVWREGDIAATPYLTVSVTADQNDGHIRDLVKKGICEALPGYRTHAERKG